MDRLRRDVLRNIGFFTATASAASLLPLSWADAQTTGSYVRRRTSPAPQIVKTPADLAAARLMLPLSPSVVMNPRRLPSYKYTPGVYESAGLQKDMRAAGEREEIGLVTEAQADWLLGGKPDNMLQQAEAHGAVPIHAVIDRRVIDVFKYPLATFDYRAGQSNHTNWRPWFKEDGTSSVTPDTAHYPALSYIPFLATRDRFHLEELQYAATWHICGYPPDYAQGKGILFPWQQRHFAWGFRNFVAAYIATQIFETENPGPLPEPLLPSSYWLQIINNNIAFYTDREIKKGQTLIREMGFIAMDYPNALAPWQQDFISMVLGWAVWTGKVPQLRPLYDFQIRQAVQRATGPLRSQAIQYNFPAGVANTWSTTLAKNGFAPTADGHFPKSVREGPDYLGYLRGALRVAVMNGVPGAAEAFTFADAEAKRIGFLTRRWAVAA